MAPLELMRLYPDMEYVSMTPGPSYARSEITKIRLGSGRKVEIFQISFFNKTVLHTKPNIEETVDSIISKESESHI